MVEEIHLGILVEMLLVVGCWLLVVGLLTEFASVNLHKRKSSLV